MTSIPATVIIAAGVLVMSGCEEQPPGPGDQPIETATDEPVPLEGDPVLLARARLGLQAWHIGIAPDQLAPVRRLGDRHTAHSPKNWITVAGTDCQAEGVPDTMTGNCPLTGDVIGVCELRVSPGGEIVDSTVLLLDSYQYGDARESDKVSTFVHEVGHCLGLRHSSQASNVMYPTAQGADRPSAGELAAVAEAYRPRVKAPSAQTRDGYFAVEEGNPVRQFAFPSFAISAAIGMPGTVRAAALTGATALPAPGAALPEGVVVVRHLLRRHHRCDADTGAP
jgi:hypothetical protein